MKTTERLTLALALASLAACGSETPMSTPTGDGSRGVTFGGAADIGQFRAVAERGEIPDESMLDPVGFFAEHAVDLPAVDCGADVCVQSGLAVAPRFDGSRSRATAQGIVSRSRRPLLVADAICPRNPPTPAVRSATAPCR